MKTLLVLFALIATCVALSAQVVPQTVEETWDLFDAKSEPLEVEIISEQLEEGIVLRHLRYVVGTFESKKTKVAAFYAFPEGRKNLPGIVQIHGGGQFAREEGVRFWASHGYAAIAINWGEKIIGKDAGAPNTDWAGIAAGFIDPKHHNDVSPGDNVSYGKAHPWNSSWLLYAAAARRAITFLESQPVVDGSRIGLSGHSMGGRLTVLTAIDPRVKAATPSVGGSGYLYEDIRGIPGSARRMRADRELYNATLDCKSYWPLIRCSVLFIGATNDFNSPMEKVIQGLRTLPGKDGAHSFTPHMNHRFTADNYAARVRWFDAHLKGEFVFPKMASSKLELKTTNGIPRFSVRPDTSTPHQLKSVTLFYGYDRDPRVRFWRSNEMKLEGGRYVANCPVMELDEPLFVFANVTYDTGADLILPRGYRPTPLLTITSEVRMAVPFQLQEAGVKVVGKRQRLIDDFSRAWQDWSLVSPDNAQHFNFKTHKLNDPAYFGPGGAELAFEIETTKPGNMLAVILETDQWRGYTGRKSKKYIALVNLDAAGMKSVSIPLNSFVTEGGEVLEHYDFVTGLILTPGNKGRPDKIKTLWQGKTPALKNLRWEGGVFASRPKTYLGKSVGKADADAAFRQQFEKEVKESVDREKTDR